MDYIKDKIVKYRMMKGWTEYRLAEESGISQPTISSWFTKGSSPSIKSLSAVCDALGITLSHLVSKTEEDEFLQLTETQKMLLRESVRLTEEQQKLLIEFLRSL